MNTETVTVLGEGAWGTAVATLLAHNGHTVNLWCYHAEIAQEITEHQTNTRYMPGTMLSPLIKATDDLAYVFNGVQWIFEAIPVQYLRSVLVRSMPYVESTHIFVALSKGIEQDTLLLPTQIIDDLFGSSLRTTVMSGPSFAKDVTQQQPTGLIIASHLSDVAADLKKIISSDFCFPELSSDLIGVQLCGALKNVIAVGMGMLEGVGYSDNTKALFITRCLQETGTLVVAAGGNQETVYGIAGMGDLILTAYGPSSRNIQVGKRLGAGEKLTSILAETGYTPEGVNSAASIRMLAQRLKINMPLCCSVYDVLYNGMHVQEIIGILHS